MRALWPLTKRKMKMNEASDTLLPCPFCGGGGFWQSEHDSDGFGVFWAIRCADCGSCTQQHYVSHGSDCPEFRAEVRASWNARAAVPAPTADVDAWARARWPGHQLHDNGKDTPLMVLIRDVWRAARAAVPAVQPTRKLWLWKNFVGGRPEYWAFDNPYPTHLDNGDPQTLGQPCGYAIFKPSRDGSCGRTEDQVLREMASVASRVAPQAPAVQPQEPVAWMCTRRLTGDKMVFSEPCVTGNPAYVKAHPHHDWQPLYAAPQSEARPGEAATERDALRDAATSLETIASLAGRKSYGDPPIETYMDTFMDVRAYAAARAKVAREALSSTPAQGDGEPARGERGDGVPESQGRGCTYPRCGCVVNLHTMAGCNAPAQGDGGGEKGPDHG